MGVVVHDAVGWGDRKQIRRHPEFPVPVIVGPHPTLALSLEWRAPALPGILHGSGYSQRLASSHRPLGSLQASLGVRSS